MTVGELMNKLKEYPKEAEVVFEDYGYSTFHINSVTLVDDTVIIE
jgi:TPP-dependent 2-oxoacid decarboxylase